MAKHKHYDCIVAWAEGKEIEFRGHEDDFWEQLGGAWSPAWMPEYQYRIKPTPKSPGHLLFKAWYGEEPENSQLGQTWENIAIQFLKAYQEEFLK